MGALPTGFGKSLPMLVTGLLMPPGIYVNLRTRLLLLFKIGLRNLTQVTRNLFIMFQVLLNNRFNSVGDNRLDSHSPAADERLQTSTRVSNLEKSREILTSLAPSRSKKLNFHSLSLLHFQDFEEKIFFLFSIYENLKHKSRSLLDLDLEFSSGSVCVWN